MFTNEPSPACLLLASPRSREDNPPPVATADFSPVALDPAEVKQGNNLVTDDFLVRTRQERLLFLKELTQAYGMTFQEKTDPVPSIVSFTSRKGIIYTKEGHAFFAKQKPIYSLENGQHHHAASMQLALAKTLSYVPPIIPTKEGQPYAFVQNAWYFLTPYIQGDFYMGKIEQSISSARVLGAMHRVARHALPPAPVSTNFMEESLKFVDLFAQLDFPDQTLHISLVHQMKQILHSMQATKTGIAGWIHGDFAPFNLLFQANTVIAVNDFDNVLYGPLSKDIAECLLTNCGVNYAGVTSSMRPPIRTTFDLERAKLMLAAYLEESTFQKEQLADLPEQSVFSWFELISVGLLRGDFSLRDVEQAIFFPRVLHQIMHDLLEAA